MADIRYREFRIVRPGLPNKHFPSKQQALDSPEWKDAPTGDLDSLRLEGLFFGPPPKPNPKTKRQGVPWFYWHLVRTRLAWFPGVWT